MDKIKAFFIDPLNLASAIFAGIFAAIIRVNDAGAWLLLFVMSLILIHLGALVYRKLYPAPKSIITQSKKKKKRRKNRG